MLRDFYRALHDCLPFSRMYYSSIVCCSGLMWHKPGVRGPKYPSTWGWRGGGTLNGLNVPSNTYFRTLGSSLRPKAWGGYGFKGRYFGF